MFCGLSKILEVLKIDENLRAFDTLTEGEKYKLGIVFLGYKNKIESNTVKDIYTLFLNEFNGQISVINKFSAKNAKSGIKNKNSLDLLQFVRQLLLDLAKLGSFDLDKLGLDDAIWIVRQHKIEQYQSLIDQKILRANGDLIMEYKQNGDSLEVLSEIWQKLKDI